MIVDSIPLGVFSVGDRVTDDVLEEDLENTTSLFVDETRNTLDTTTTSETTDSLRGPRRREIGEELSIEIGYSGTMKGDRLTGLVIP